MTDWKKNVDEAERKRILEQDKKEREERERREKEKWEWEKKREEKELAEWKRKYKCHICGQSTTGPKYAPMDTSYTDRGGHYPSRSGRAHPGGLNQCQHCNKWACGDHWHQGKCQKCWAADGIQI